MTRNNHTINIVQKKLLIINGSYTIVVMADYKENIFTKIIKGEIQADIILTNSSGIVFADKYPKYKIHFIAIPIIRKINFMDFIQTSNFEDINYFFQLINMSIKKLQIENAFQLITNGGKYQDIGHFHMHIISGLDKEDVTTCKSDVLIENNAGTVFLSGNNPAKHRIHFIASTKENFTSFFDFINRCSNILEFFNLVNQAIKMLRIENAFQLITNGGQYQKNNTFQMHIISDIIN